MIKAQATINGVICKQANLRTDKDGKTFTGFTVKVTVPGSRNNMAGKEVFVSVNKDGETDPAQLPVGNRIEMTGTLSFRKLNDNLYFNFHADSMTVNPTSPKDSITGTMEFKGTVGHNVEEKSDKKGGKYVTFTAFSTEKNNDQFAFTWIRFIRFNYEREAFLQPKAKIHVAGQLSVTAYNGRIDLDCRADEIQPWERDPYPGLNPVTQIS